MKKEPANHQNAVEAESTQRRCLSQRITNYLRENLAPWREYAASQVFLPSLALSMLYLTVLSFAATMVTYLLHSGFTSLEVSYMRIGSVAAELCGTWAAPLIMNRIGPIRSGLWFLNWQFCCLAGAAAAFVLWDSNSRLAAGSLIVGVALSRVGLWGFDLSVQFLVQDVSASNQVKSVIAKLIRDYPRISKNMPEHGFLRRKWPCRISSRCFLLCRLSFGLSQSSSSIL